MNSTSPAKVQNPIPALLFVIGFRLLISLFWLARFSGYWVEGDTVRTIAGIQAVYESGRLYPENFRLYSNGFLYQVYVTVIARLTGQSVIDVQLFVLPIVVTLIVVAAYAFYLRVLGSPAAAAISTILLSLQGDFLFTSMRGTHEKTDYMLIFVSLLTLLLSVKWFDKLRARIALAVVYYMTILSQNTVNVFFSSTFTALLLLSFALWRALAWYTKRKAPGVNWFFYISILGLFFTFLVMFVWYPPALNVVYAAHDVGERVMLFLFSPDAPPAEVITSAASAWIFPNAWLYLRLFDMLIMVIAAIGWIDLLRQSRNTESGKFSPLETNHFWLLILLPGFAIQNAVVILSDLTGSSGEINNLQIRLIPLTVFIAVPTATYAILRFVEKLKSKMRVYALAAVILAALVFSLGTGLIKSSSEPALSNAWIFYSPSEAAGVRWLDQYTPRIGFDYGWRTPLVWGPPDFRLGNVWLGMYWQSNRDIVPFASFLYEPYTYILISPETWLSSDRLRTTIPDLRGENRIYDNGEVQIYYNLPEDRK
jgi:hypothetical protein